MRELDKAQHEQLKDALVQAFLTKGALNQLVYYGIKKDLGTIIADGNIEDMVFNVIRWTEVHGCRDDLVNEAFERNKGNPALIRFRQEVWEPLVQAEKAALSQPTSPVKAPTDKLVLSSDCCLDVDTSASTSANNKSSSDPICSGDDPAQILHIRLLVYTRDVREAIEKAQALFAQNGEVYQDQCQMVCKRIEQNSQTLHTVLNELVVTQLVNIELHEPFKVNNDYLWQKIKDVVLPMIEKSGTQGPLLYTVRQDMFSNLTALVQSLEHMDHQIYEFCSQVDPTINIDQFDFYRRERR